MAKIRAMQIVAITVLCGTAGLAGAVAVLGGSDTPAVATRPAPAPVKPATIAPAVEKPAQL